MGDELQSEAAAISEFRTNTNKSILRDILLGDLVELLADGKFFNRNDGQYERYGGYVSLITKNTIGVSATNPENRVHGYTGTGVVGGFNRRQQEVIEIDTYLIKKYRVL